MPAVGELAAQRARHGGRRGGSQDGQPLTIAQERRDVERRRNREAGGDHEAPPPAERSGRRGLTPKSARGERRVTKSAGEPGCRGEACPRRPNLRWTPLPWSSTYGLINDPFASGPMGGCAISTCPSARDVASGLIHVGQRPTIMALRRDAALSLPHRAGVRQVASCLRLHSQHLACAVAFVLGPLPKGVDADARGHLASLMRRSLRRRRLRCSTCCHRRRHPWAASRRRRH